MPTVTTEIEIAGSPETVRSVFLSFQRSNECGWKFATSDPNKQPVDLQPGDQLKIDLRGTKFNPKVVENSPSSFQWHGDLYGLFNGTHQFHFTPSKKTPGATTFVQKEDFGGILSFLLSFKSLEKQTETNYGKFNEDLKAAVEGAAR